MADTGQCVVWEWEPADGVISTDLEPQKGMFWHFADNELLWKAIRVGNLESRLRTEFTVTDRVWYGLWMDSPLNAAQCSVLYDLFSLFIVREKELRRRLTEFLQALQEVSRGHGQLKVWLGSPGHTDFGIMTTFAHCPRCKVKAPVPEWHASEYHDEISCPLCGTRYVPAEMYSAEKDEYEVEPMDTAPRPQPRKENRFFRILWILFILPWEFAYLMFGFAQASYFRIVRVRRRPLKPSQQR